MGLVLFLLSRMGIGAAVDRRRNVLSSRTDESAISLT